MKQATFITMTDARHTFSLAGFEHLVGERETIRQTLAPLLAREGSGLLLLDERLLDADGWLQMEEQARRRDILLVTLPAPDRGETDDEGDDQLQRLFTRVLGYRIKLPPGENGE